MFQDTQQNTPASAALPSAPITMTIKPMMTPFSTWLDHLSPFAHCLLYATIAKAPQPTRHSVPYSTSLLTILSPSSLSSSGFTQLFTPFSLGPPGAQQIPLTPSKLLLLGNPPLSLPLSSVSLRHKNLPSTFYISRNSIMPSSSSFPPSFFHSWKVND